MDTKCHLPNHTNIKENANHKDNIWSVNKQRENNTIVRPHLIDFSIPHTVADLMFKKTSVRKNYVWKFESFSTTVLMIQMQFQTSNAGTWNLPQFPDQSCYRVNNQM